MERSEMRNPFKSSLLRLKLEEKLNINLLLQIRLYRKEFLAIARNDKESRNYIIIKIKK